MDNKVLKQRKLEVEKRFNELEDSKQKILAQNRALQESLKMIYEEQTKLRGAYEEVCNLLGLDPKDPKNLDIKVDRTKDKK